MKHKLFGTVAGALILVIGAYFVVEFEENHSESESTNLEQKRSNLPAHAAGAARRPASSAVEVDGHRANSTTGAAPDAFDLRASAGRWLVRDTLAVVNQVLLGEHDDVGKGPPTYSELLDQWQENPKFVNFVDAAELDGEQQAKLVSMLAMVDHQIASLTQTWDDSEKIEKMSNRLRHHAKVTVAVRLNPRQQKLLESSNLFALASKAAQVNQ
jgi:hypothetical protein